MKITILGLDVIDRVNAQVIEGAAEAHIDPEATQIHFFVIILQCDVFDEYRQDATLKLYLWPRINNYTDFVDCFFWRYYRDNFLCNK